MRRLTVGLLALMGFGAAACTTMDPSEPGHLVPNTVAEDPTIPAIELNGSRFHAETFGNPANPVIVFLHGGPGLDYRGMLPLAQRYNGYSLADEYFLVFWDQRGSGLSARHDKDVLTLAQFDADLDAIINRYAPGRRVLLVGESWGAMYATEYINEHATRVAGAVLIESGPMTGVTSERIKAKMFDLDLAAEWMNDYAWSSQFLTPNDHARMDYERMLGFKNSQPSFHQDENNPAPVWRIGAAAGRYLQEGGQDARGVAVYDFTTKLAQFTTPVLFIAGARSEVLGESLQVEQVKHYPSASLVVIPGAGHDVSWVKTAEVLQAIRPYLSARKAGAQ